MLSCLVDFFSRYWRQALIALLAAAVVVFALSLLFWQSGRSVTIDLGPEGSSGYSFYTDLPPIQVVGERDGDVEQESFTITITFEAENVTFGQSFKTSGLLGLLEERGYYEEGHSLGMVRILERPARIIIERPYYARPYAVVALRGGNRLGYTVTVYEASLIGSEVLNNGIIIFRKFREQ